MNQSEPGKGVEHDDRTWMWRATELLVGTYWCAALQAATASVGGLYLALFPGQFSDPEVATSGHVRGVGVGVAAVAGFAAFVCVGRAIKPDLDATGNHTGVGTPKQP